MANNVNFENWYFLPKKKQHFDLYSAYLKICKIFVIMILTYSYCKNSTIYLNEYQVLS